MQIAKKSHELRDQDSVLDICSGVLHLRSDESLVPASINRHSLEDAKVLQQVDKKYIPIVACGTVAIVDQVHPISSLLPRLPEIIDTLSEYS